jgi:hypothetical protein
MIPINAAARAMHATASASERLVGIAMSICARTLRMSVLALAFLTACTEHAPLAPATDRTAEPVENTARQIGRVDEPAMHRRRSSCATIAASRLPERA